MISARKLSEVLGTLRLNGNTGGSALHSIQAVGMTVGQSSRGQGELVKVASLAITAPHISVYFIPSCWAEGQLLPGSASRSQL